MADNPVEQWTRWVALTTTILAVAAAISSLKSGSFSTRMQLATTEGNNKWAYFQSKSIKQHICEVELDNFELFLLDAHSPAAHNAARKKIDVLKSDIFRYNNEKKEISDDATKTGLVQNMYKERSGKLSIAVMFLQIGIMLSSISALLKRPPAWYAGLAMGFAGLIYMVLGLI